MNALEEEVAVDNQNIDELVAQRVIQRLTVTVTTDAQGELCARTTPEFIKVAYDKFCEMQFTLVNELTSEIANDIAFEDPPVSFYTTVPAITLVSSDRQHAKVLWGNLDRAYASRSYDYRVRVRVGDRTISHDPTVENDPPPIPTP
jgi:hypothetical protein